MEEGEKLRFTPRFNVAALLFEWVVFFAVFKGPIFALFMALAHLVVANLIWATVFKAALFRAISVAAGKGALSALLRFFVRLFRGEKRIEVPEQIKTAMQGAETIFEEKIRATARWMFIPSAVGFAASLFAGRVPLMVAAGAMATTGFVGMMGGKRLLIAPISFESAE